MSFKIDASKFKKVGGDKDHTIMRHKDGHEMRISHKMLSPKMRGQLAEMPSMMADGGEAEPGKYVDPKAAKDISTGSQESGWQPEQWGKNLREGLGISPSPTPKKMADGGEAADNQQQAPMQVATDPSQVQMPQQMPASQQPITINVGQPAAAAAAPQPFTMPSMGSQPYGAPSPAPVAPPAQSNDIPQQAPSAPPPGGASASWQPPANAPMPGVEQPLPQAQLAASQADPYGNEAYGNAFAKGINEQKAGIMGQAQAQAQEGQAQAGALQNNISVQQQALQTYKDHFAELDKERQNFMTDIQNQHIDPNHYMNSMGTGGKIKAAIGLILGGFGAVAHQGNGAMDYLNNQISRDIDAQKAELGKKENLLSANFKQFGNLRDAADMTRVMQSDIVSNQLKAAAAKAMTPMAKAQALQAAGKLDQDSSATLAQIAMRKSLGQVSMTGGGKDDGRIPQTIQMLRMINPAMAKSMEERYVPGVGVATSPVPNEVRGTLIAKQQLQNQAQDFYKWASQHSGSLDPRIVNEGKTKAAELQSLYRNSINGGVFKKGEQEFIDQIVDSDPTKFFNKIRVLPKLEEILNSNSQQLNTLKKGYGLPATTQIQQSAPVRNK